MSKLRELLTREPVLIRSLLMAGIGAIIELTPAQSEATGTLIDAGLGLLIVLIGVDARAKVTPTAAPNLATETAIPPELHKAALEVAKYLPAPVSQIVQAVGIPGLELAVKAAQNAMRRAPNPDELKQGADAEAASRFRG